MDSKSLDLLNDRMYPTYSCKQVITGISVFSSLGKIARCNPTSIGTLPGQLLEPVLPSYTGLVRFPCAALSGFHHPRTHCPDPWAPERAARHCTRPLAAQKQPLGHKDLLNVRDHTETCHPTFETLFPSYSLTVLFQSCFMSLRLLTNIQTNQLDHVIFYFFIFLFFCLDSTKNIT